MSIYEEPIVKVLSNRSPQLPTNSNEIIIPLRGVTYCEKCDEYGVDGVELCIAFADNPLKYIPTVIDGKFREIMANSSWDWITKRLVVHLPKESKIGVDCFLDKMTEALENMMAEEGKAEENNKAN